MKKIAGALLFLFFCGCCYAQVKTGTAQQEAVSDPYVWNFGAVEEGQVLNHDFVIKNTSAKTLNIKETNTSCGCTVSEVEKKALAPQESTRVKVEFRSKGYSGKTQQFIYVNTDSLDEPVIRFIIKAEVQ